VCVTCIFQSSFFGPSFSLSINHYPDCFFIMSRRDDNRDRASRSQPQAYSSARTSQFVIDAEGIDREVITADICRYLGNDALVKPGDVEVSSFVTAYCGGCRLIAFMKDR
jgi:hypothetical protein